MIIKCPKCLAIISTNSRQSEGKDTLTCRCGQDLSGFDPSAQTNREILWLAIRTVFRNSVVGVTLGTLAGIFVAWRFAHGVALQNGNIGVWMILAAGPLIGFLLAVVLGERFRDWVESLLE